MADILVVDDDRDLAESLADLLAEEGHSVRIACDGKEGLIALDQALPDLVLLDIDMPELDGPGMAHMMFVQDVGRERIPIVISSASIDLASVADRVGTTYCVPKPSEIEALLSVIGRALTERAAPNERKSP